MAAVYSFVDTAADPFNSSDLMESQQQYMQAIALPANFVSPWDDEDHPENFIPGPEDQYQPQSIQESWEEDEDQPENIPPPNSIQYGGHWDIPQVYDEYDDDGESDDEFVDILGELAELNGEIVTFGNELAVILGFDVLLDQRSNLSQEIIAEHLQTLKYQKLAKQDEDEDEVDELCVICQDEFKSGEMLGTLGCRHEFHADCIKRWLQVKNVCPICKRMAVHHQEI
ncbi:E3 ubiquitin ligase BIG BROTHER-related-like [Coffea eugenioides]|uniref:E3 ubiquitin ligase BIG BROTHER-related-like n=1 Tax=Coffea eugenioides TaxID=49369 RepID=UPI000F606C77|nr:E3 ubiquitin ligase BIG BROTHER-related-like [Coffea eugenioides]